MRRPGSVAVVKIRSVLSFTHSAIAKDARSLATKLFSQSSSALGRFAVGTLTTLCADKGELEGCKRES